MRDPHMTVALRPVERIVSGERIGMKQTTEPRKVIARPLAFAVGTVAIERRRRAASIVSSGVDGIDPEPRRDRATQPRR